MIRMLRLYDSYRNVAKQLEKGMGWF